VRLAGNFTATINVTMGVAKGRQTLDAAARVKVYQDLYRAMVEDPGYIFTHAQDTLWAKRASSDWGFNPFAGNASNPPSYN